MTEIRTDEKISEILTILAVFSAVFLLVGSLACLAFPIWPVRMYVSITGMLFDLLFTVEFLARSTGLMRFPGKGTKKTALNATILFCHAVLPFLFVSGPFLFGWAYSDIGAAAVRGFDSSITIFATFGTLTWLRLLRLAVPWLQDSAAARRDKPLLLALLACASLLVLGAILLNGMILPGYKKATTDSRRELTGNLPSLDRASLHSVSRTVPEIVALSVDGKAVYTRSRSTPLMPGDYEYYAAKTTGAWFSTSGQRNARLVTEALFYGGACLMALCLALFSSSRANRHKPQTLPSAKRPAVRGIPVGKEELEGILGKKP